MAGAVPAPVRLPEALTPRRPQLAALPGRWRTGGSSPGRSAKLALDWRWPAAGAEEEGPPPPPGGARRPAPGGSQSARAAALLRTRGGEGPGLSGPAAAPGASSRLAGEARGRDAGGAGGGGPAPFSRGEWVVDVCSGRRACALGTTKTHCKVIFESEEKYPLEVVREGRIDIVPLAQLCAWSPRWEGLDGQPAAHPSLKGATVAGGLPHLDLACTAAPQKLQLKDLAPIEAARHSASLSCRGSARALGGASPRPFRLSEDEELLANFRRLLAASCGGSLLLGWCTVLDSRRAGRVAFQDMVRAGRSLGFAGNYTRLWELLGGAGAGAAAASSSTAALSGTMSMRSQPSSLAPKYHGEDGRHIGLEALDAEAAEVLARFRGLLRVRRLSPEELWERHLDTRRCGRCPLPDFVEGMQQVGWEEGRSAALFRLLDAGRVGDVFLQQLVPLVPKHRARREDNWSHLRHDNVLLGTPVSHRERRKTKQTEVEQKILADFSSYLVSQFGSVVRAWRKSLDFDGDGRLRFQEFVAGCKLAGYRGQLKTLWNALDFQRKGFVELIDLDQEAGQRLDDFRDFLEESYRTLEDVWERVFDCHGSGRCLQDQFVAGCARVGWRGNALQMFRWLDLSGGKDLTMDEMTFIGMRRRKETMITAKERILERQARDAEQAGAMLQKFRGHLEKLCGNLVHAWRLYLDPDGDDRLQFTEFCMRCRELGFQGNLKALWLSLDQDDTGYVSLEELNPEATVLLNDFREVLQIYFDSRSKAWSELLDADGSGRCSLQEFLLACEHLGFDEAKGERVFDYLDSRADHRTEPFFEIMDLEFVWKEEVAHHDITQDRSSLKNRAYTRSGKNLAEQGARAFAAFENFLRHEFCGDVVHGWRKGFCRGPRELQWSERVTAEAFCQRCRTLGFQDNYLALWNHLLSRKVDCSADANATESFVAATLPRRSYNIASVTMASIAPEVHEELLAFRAHCRWKFGASADSAWRALLKECLKSPDEKRLRKVEFVQAARNIGFQGDGDAVFAACDMDQEHTVCFKEFEFLQLSEIGRDPASRRRRSSLIVRSERQSLDAILSVVFPDPRPRSRGSSTERSARLRGSPRAPSARTSPRGSTARSPAAAPDPPHHQTAAARRRGRGSWAGAPPAAEGRGEAGRWQSSERLLSDQERHESPPRLHHPPPPLGL